MAKHLNEITSQVAFFHSAHATSRMHSMRRGGGVCAGLCLSVALGASARSLMGCGSSPPPPAHAEHGHHDHPAGHGPLVHRFEHAEAWAKEFDDPARDGWQKPSDVVAAMGIREGQVVADVGAGTGYFEPWLSRAVGASGSVLAVDIEPDMIRYLGERAKREHLANVTPVLAATDDPRLPIGKVDRILIVDTWHHIDARPVYAAKLRDALAADGKIFIVDFTMTASHGPPREHRLSPDQVVGELAAGGLAAEVVPVGLPEQWVIMAKRR